jgi:hypothetical protein
MNRYPQEKTSQIIGDLLENVAPRPSPPRRPLGRYRAWRLERRRQVEARRLERRRQAKDQLLASRVQDIIIGCGLTQFGYSIGGSRILRAPPVVSVVAGPPVGVDILILPGQMPDHFAVHAPAIAYNLGVTEVRVVPLEPSRIRLELLQGPG